MNFPSIHRAAHGRRTGHLLAVYHLVVGVGARHEPLSTLCSRRKRWLFLADT